MTPYKFTFPSKASAMSFARGYIPERVVARQAPKQFIVCAPATARRRKLRVLWCNTH
jgi:hypothetical protein